MDKFFEKLIVIAVLIIFSIVYKLSGIHYFNKDFEEFLTFVAVAGGALIAIIGLFAVKNALSGQEKLFFWADDEKINELIAAYKAATNDNERDAVLEEYSTKHNVTKRGLRAGLVRRDVYIAKVRPDNSASDTGSIQKHQIKGNSKADELRTTRHTLRSDYSMQFGEIDDYTVVKGKTSAELVQNVKEKMRSGWQPFGAVGAAAFGISPVGGNQYIQAMVKYRNPS